MSSHVRKRAPLASLHGMPDACTRAPGAWPTISTVAVADAASTGRGACGKTGAQIVQARMSRIKVSSVEGFVAVMQVRVLDARRTAASLRESMPGFGRIDQRSVRL